MSISIDLDFAFDFAFAFAFLLFLHSFGISTEHINGAKYRQVPRGAKTGVFFSWMTRIRKSSIRVDGSGATGFFGCLINSHRIHDKPGNDDHNTTGDR